MNEWSRNAEGHSLNTKEGEGQFWDKSILESYCNGVMTVLKKGHAMLQYLNKLPQILHPP